MRLRILIVSILVMLACPALADWPVTGVGVGQGCVQFTLCDAEADGGLPCKTSDASNVLVARIAGNYVQTLYATQSTATAFTCHLYSSDNGYSATLRQQITSVALTETQYVITIEGPLDYEWIECATITGGVVTVTSTACPLGR